MKKTINTQTREDFLRALGKQIEFLRKKKHMTQLELAIKCNTDVRKIGGTERGEYDFRISSLLVLAQGLGVAVSEIIDIKNSDEFVKTIWTNIEECTEIES